MSLNVVWIDGNIVEKEYVKYLKNIESNNSLKVQAFKNTDDALNYMKNLKFQETKVILSGRLYSKFIKDFKENLKEIFIVPKIIIFTSNKDNFIKYNEEYLKSENAFYTFGGIATTFIEINLFLKNESPSEKNTKIYNENKFLINDSPIYKIMKTLNENELIFHYIDNKDKLMLPLFYKSLLDKTSIKNIEEYTNYLYNIYSKKNSAVERLLGPIKSISNIPIEILSKYYARLLTIESDFYKDINKDLRLNKIEKYLPYIKTLYEGVKLKSLPLSEDKILYRGSKISNDEMIKIKNYIEKPIKGMPGTIAYSRSFLSFHKYRNVAETFLQVGKANKNLLNVLFILEKDDNMDYNLMTHCDMEAVSLYPKEGEVLFFPFSCFEIKDIKEMKIYNEKIYEIRLLYLGNYLKDIENNNNINFIDNKIPDSEFKKQLFEYGLIKTEKEKEEKRDSDSAFSEKLYKNYIKEINNEKNFIISEVNISSEDINKDIQIINSYENYRRKHESIDNKINPEFDNEKDIKENIEMRINGEKIPFSYMYKFKKEGKYKIEYIFKKNLTKINHMFYGCWKLTSLDLSNYNTKNAINMSYMFYDCFSLSTLNLSNFNTENAEKTVNMFNGCKSLQDINLANSHTQNVNDKSSLFYDCNSLKKKILSLKNLKFE